MASNELTFDHKNDTFYIHLIAVSGLPKLLGTHIENESLKMKIHHSVFVISML